MSLLDRWEWSDPMVVIGVLTIAVTGLIPVFVWRLGAKQAELDSKSMNRQVVSLERQENLAKKQRRDGLLATVEEASDTTHLSLLFSEISQFESPDRDLLLSVFRSNDAVALPGTSQGLVVNDELDAKAIRDYSLGLERRYSVGDSGFRPYEGLISFLVSARTRSLSIDVYSISALVTGDTARIQNPGHTFYRELVNVCIDISIPLINSVEKIDYRASGGLRLNVLTGSLFGIYDVIKDSSKFRSQGDSIEEFRQSLASALASLLHRNNLRSFDNWTTTDSTEPVSATVAWLIRVVGWLADVDDHLAMRMVENLPSAISSIPAEDRSWGVDKVRVQEGFAEIARKAPVLWDRHGSALEKAATEVGSWGPGTDE